MTEQEMVTVRDVSQLREESVELGSVPADATWGEFIGSLVETLDLPPNPSGGYQGRLERVGQRVNQTDRVHADLRAGDVVTLEPDVQAGC